jgi:hypothetical protein
MKTTSKAQKIKNLVSDLIKVNTEYFRNELSKKRLNQFESDAIHKLHQFVYEEYAPCFVLSTGRCGTALLNKVLEAHPQIMAVHNPLPEFSYHSGFAYVNHSLQPDICKAHFDGARYEPIRNAFIEGKFYVETNQRITFFAYQLAEMFPKARFIHLYRHPHSFISSGVARNWYSASKLTDEGRITMSDSEVWNALTQDEKVAWLWQETNAFIEGFKSKYGERVLTVKAEEFFKDPHITVDIFNQIGVNALSTSKIKQMIKKPVNKQPKKVLKSTYSKRVEEILVLKSTYYPNK